MQLEFDHPGERNNKMLYRCGILNGTNFFKWQVGILGALKAYLAICVQHTRLANNIDKHNEQGMNAKMTKNIATVLVVDNAIEIYPCE